MVESAAVLAVIRTARPAFRNKHDKVAFAIHASFVTSGYRLIAAGAAAEADTSEKDEEVDVGIDGWNELPDEYAFKYAPSEDVLKTKPMRVLVKCLVIGEYLTVDAVEATAGVNGVVHNVEIRVAEYAASECAANYSQAYTNLRGLLVELESAVLRPLSKRSAGYEAAAAVSSTLKPVGGGRRPGSTLEDSRQPASYPPPFMRVGEDDLLPQPLRGGGVFEGGGMLLGPNDRRWGGMGMGMGMGAPGRPGMLPPGVPPGARFDPFGPPGMPGFEAGRFGNPGGRRGFDPNHPDLEQYRDSF